MNAFDSQLDDRERRIMVAMCMGQENNEIAAEMGVKRESVTQSISRIVRYMGARTTREATFIYGKAEIPEGLTVEQVAGRIAKVAIECAQRRLEESLDAQEGTAA